MRKIIAALLTATVIYGCATATPQYNATQFNNESYQQNVANALDFSDNFVDFDEAKFPQAELNSADLATLLQADLAYNQGQYEEAAPFYSTLAEKYHDPRLIYKAIVSFEHSAKTAEQFARLNQLMQQLVAVAPDSKVAQLFGIKVALESANYEQARNNLKHLTSKTQARTRQILLFLASILSSNSQNIDQPTLTKFTQYVTNKYSAYPEAGLLAVVSYSITNNQEELLSTLEQLAETYPNWEVPDFWAAGLLARDNNRELLAALADKDLAQRDALPAGLQNLLVAIRLHLEQISEAHAWVESAVAANPQDGNMLVNLGIVDYKLGHTESAIQALRQALALNVTLDSTVNFALASLYDAESQNSEALAEYYTVTKNNKLLTPVANLAIMRIYLQEKNSESLDNFISEAPQYANLSLRDQTLLKLTMLVEFGDYEQGYQLISSKMNLYKYDRAFIYFHAALAGLSGRTTEAIKNYKKYIKLNPQDPLGYNDLGFTLVDKTSHYLEGLKYAKIAYKLQPNDAAIMDTLGYAYFKLGQYHKAEPLLKQAFLASHDPDTAKHLRQLYLAMGDAKAAQKVVIPPEDVKHLQIRQTLLNQAMLILMYYQFGVDLSK